MEIYTGGAKPYAGFNNTMVMMKVASGYMIPKPADCPDDVYKLMVQCWAMEPDMRPRFSEMATSLASTYPLPRLPTDWECSLVIPGNALSAER